MSTYQSHEPNSIKKQSTVFKKISKMSKMILSFVRGNRSVAQSESPVSSKTNQQIFAMKSVYPKIAYIAFLNKLTNVFFAMTIVDLQSMPALASDSLRGGKTSSGLSKDTAGVSSIGNRLPRLVSETANNDKKSTGKSRQACCAFDPANFTNK